MIFEQEAPAEGVVCMLVGRKFLCLQRAGEVLQSPKETRGVGIAHNEGFLEPTCFDYTPDKLLAVVYDAGKKKLIIFEWVEMEDAQAIINARRKDRAIRANAGDRSARKESISTGVCWVAVAEFGLPGADEVCIQDSPDPPFPYDIVVRCDGGDVLCLVKQSLPDQEGGVWKDV